MIDLPEPPTSVADVALAQEIRQYIRGQKSPIDVAVKFMSNPRILGAIDRTSDPIGSQRH